MMDIDYTCAPKGKLFCDIVGMLPCARARARKIEATVRGCSVRKLLFAAEKKKNYR